MIELSNGEKIEYLVASGALAFDGRGWAWDRPFFWFGLIQPKEFTIITKSLTLSPRKGNLNWFNPFGCFRFIWQKNGTPKIIGGVNAVGLTNLGIDWYMEKIAPEVNRKKQKMIGSIYGTPDELVAMAKILNRVDYVGLELNVSCPNVVEKQMESDAKVIVETCKRVKEVSKHPLLLKLSCAQPYEEISKRLTDESLRLFGKPNALIEAIEPNSVPWGVAYGAKRSPLHYLGGGGVSGKPAQRDNWEMIGKLAKMQIPIIGNSIWEYEDVAQLRKLGARALSFGIIFMRYPWRPTAFVKREMKK